jgi:predicted membrane channel-forming protein YqfA (hemolysin III family)
MMALGASVNLLINLIITQLAPHMMATIGWCIFVIYAIICLAVSTIYYSVLYETKNKSLEEITQLAIRQRVSIFKV